MKRHKLLFCTSFFCPRPQVRQLCYNGKDKNTIISKKVLPKYFAQRFVNVYVYERECNDLITFIILHILFSAVPSPKSI